MPSSTDWVRGPGGRWVREPVQQMCSPNRSFNHTLKRVFNAIFDAGDRSGRKTNHHTRAVRATPGGGHEGPLTAGEVLTIARQHAAIVLAVCRTREAEQTPIPWKRRSKPVRDLGERGVESVAQRAKSDAPAANRLQLPPSEITPLGRGRVPKPPLKGYAPLESRTKRWASQSPRLAQPDGSHSCSERRTRRLSNVFQTSMRTLRAHPSTP